jgi:hypothetical protein
LEQSLKLTRLRNTEFINITGIIVCVERTSFSGWAKRAELSLAIMDLLQELEVMFESPVHLCDVKPEHFGLSEQVKSI